jgi:type IV secretion system protein VirD4
LADSTSARPKHSGGFFGLMGDAVRGALVLAIIVIIFNYIYYWATGKSGHWQILATLAAGFGTLAAISSGVDERIGKSAVAGEGRFASYLRVVVPALVMPPMLVFVLLFIFLLALDVFAVPISDDELTTKLVPLIFLALGCGLLVGIFGAFFATCSHAYKRREFLPLAIAGAVLNGAIWGAAILFVAAAAWFNWQHGTLVPWNTIPIIVVVGAIIGVAFELWRTFGKPRDRSTAGTIGGPISFLAETAGRGKVLVVGLWFAGIGFILLWWSVRPLLTALENRAGAPDDWLWPAIGTAVGGYFFLARGVGPIWNAIRWSSLSTETHGLARLATIRELRSAGLAPCKSGIYLGQFLDNGATIDTVGYPGPVHLITIGPTGSGKGTGLIIPNLSELRRSILIIDPKGEAAAITARKRAQFGRVIMLNPFQLFVREKPWLKSNGFNPLLLLDPKSDSFHDDATGIAEALVRVEGTQPHWSESAQDLVAALVMYEVIVNGDAASLGNVRAMLTEPYGQDREGDPIGLSKRLQHMYSLNYAPLNAKIGRLMHVTNEMRSILSAAMTQTRFLDSPPVAADLASRNRFSFGRMKEEIITVYLILPATELTRHSNWLRLIIASALQSLLATPRSQKLVPVTFLLDEFAQLGHLPAISNAMNIARSFGIQLWPVIQDLNQLKSIYGENWENFMSACATLTAFAPRDLFTASYLSRRFGDKTVIVESENVRPESGLPGGGRSPQGLPLFRPEELMRMPAGQMLCLAAPVEYPFMTQAPGYWKTAFGRGLDENPYRPS